MSEKSGVEMIEEVLFMLSNLEKRLDVIDRNIKTIANSSNLAVLVNKAAGTSLDGWTKAIQPGIPTIVSAEAPEVKENVVEASGKGFKNFGFEASDASQLSGQPHPRRGSVSPKVPSILVKGKLRFDQGEKTIPLSGVSVKIYDTTDTVVKSTKTNRAGHWMSHLPPGNYVALFEGEVDGKKLSPQNKNFEVPEKLKEGQIEFEVI